MSAPGTCPACGTAMRPLLTGSFCPNDCDRRTVVDTPVYGLPITRLVAEQSPRQGPWLPHRLPGILAIFPARISLGERRLTAVERHSLLVPGEDRSLCPFCLAPLTTVERNGETSIDTCDDWRRGPHRIRVYEGQPCP